MKPTERYWKERYTFSGTIGEMTEIDMRTRLKRLYANAMLEIDREIEAFYGRYAHDNSLTVSEVRKLLDPAELKAAKFEISRYYEEIDSVARDANGKVSARLLRRYKKKLREYSARAYMSRLEELKIKIRNSLVKLGLREDAIFDKGLSKAFRDTYNASSEELGRYTGFSNTISQKKVETLVNTRWLGRNYSERVWKNKGILEKSLERTFMQGMMRGQNPRKIAMAMQKDMGGAYHRCERLARTEAMHIVNEATFESYKDYGVKEYEFITGEDERTCEICGDLDGEHFPLSEKVEGENYPVMHPNCRCTTAPYFED